jgi:hypothetical protein
VTQLLKPPEMARVWWVCYMHQPVFADFNHEDNNNEMVHCFAYSHGTLSGTMPLTSAEVKTKKYGTEG